VFPRRLWRLSPIEYSNTVGAVINGRRSGAQPIVPMPDTFAVPLLPNEGRYSTESAANIVSLTEFKAAATVVRGIANYLVQTFKLNTCWATDSALAFESCAASLIQDRGAILFRRPLTLTEAARYVQIAKDARVELNPDLALATAFQTLMLAPEFMFKPEIGASTGVPFTYKLTSYEVGALLAYALTQAPPDTELWQAANLGQLSTPAEIKAQVARLMSLPAAAGARNFVTEYFKLHQLLSVSKAADVQVGACRYNRERLVASAEALVSDVYATNSTSNFIGTLFTTPNVYADCGSETLYGLTGTPPDTGSPARFAAPQGQRAGFLTSPAWLGAMAGASDTKPARRGWFINEDVLCRSIPPHPPNVLPAPLDANLTMREALSAQETSATCAGCHSLLDAPGLAFEIFDTVGSYRTLDKNKPIDASGTLTGVDDASVSFTNGVDLSVKLGQSKTVQQCVMKNAFKYFMGREVLSSDECSLSRAEAAYAPSGSYVDFVAELITSDSALIRGF